MTSYESLRDGKEREYKMVIYDNKTEQEESNLTYEDAELRIECLRLAYYFKHKQQGRLEIKLILRENGERR